MTRLTHLLLLAGCGSSALQTHTYDPDAESSASTPAVDPGSEAPSTDDTTAVETTPDDAEPPGSVPGCVVVEETDDDLDGLLDYTFTTTWSDDGLLLERHLQNADSPSFTTWSYAYDGQGSMREMVEENSSGDVHTLRYSNVHDSDGRLIRQEMAGRVEPAGVDYVPITTTYTWDGDHAALTEVDRWADGVVDEWVERTVDAAGTVRDSFYRTEDGNTAYSGVHRFYDADVLTSVEEHRPAYAGGPLELDTTNWWAYDPQGTPIGVESTLSDGSIYHSWDREALYADGELLETSRVITLHLDGHEVPVIELRTQWDCPSDVSVRPDPVSDTGG